MIKENKKRITISLNNFIADFLEDCSKKNKKTKSQIVHNLLFTTALSYWSNPNAWKDYIDNEKNKTK